MTNAELKYYNDIAIIKQQLMRQNDLLEQLIELIKNERENSTKANQDKR